MAEAMGEGLEVRLAAPLSSERVLVTSQ